MTRYIRKSRYLEHLISTQLCRHKKIFHAFIWADGSETPEIVASFRTDNSGAFVKKSRSNSRLLLGVINIYNNLCVVLFFPCETRRHTQIVPKCSRSISVTRRRTGLMQAVFFGGCGSGDWRCWLRCLGLHRQSQSDGICRAESRHPD